MEPLARVRGRPPLSSTCPSGAAHGTDRYDEIRAIYGVRTDIQIQMVHGWEPSTWPSARRERERERSHGSTIQAYSMHARHRESPPTPHRPPTDSPPACVDTGYTVLSTAHRMTRVPRRSRPHGVTYRPQASPSPSDGHRAISRVSHRQPRQPSSATQECSIRPCWTAVVTGKRGGPPLRYRGFSAPCVGDAHALKSGCYS